MGPIAKIKAVLRLRRIAKEATKEVTTMNGVKPGVLTTEFWGKNVIQLVLLYNAFFQKDIDPQLAVQMVSAIEGLYHALRVATKIGKDIAEAVRAKKETPAVATPAV